MSRWWVSWYQPPGRSSDDDIFRGASCVVGVWVSGMRLSDKAPTVCALVDAPTEERLRRRVAAIWPEAMTEEWRFCYQVEADWTPGDRFPLPNRDR